MQLMKNCYNALQAFELPLNEFMQIRKSFAVATKHIESIEENFIYISDDKIPNGKTCKLNVVQLLK